MADPPVDPEAFWRLGALPPSPGSPPGFSAGELPGCGLDLVGRPEITVDGRNLADVLRPVYGALTAQ
jgi:hypothetical protein